MTIRLRDLVACFEGVIPSIIATAAPDGTPNISYLSHVVLVDDERVALSNQFFSKTAANVRANPTAAVLIVDPRDGAQYQLYVAFEQTLDSGELFEEMAAQLRATSTQMGLGEVMRLRGVDIYRVEAVHAVPSTRPRLKVPSREAGLQLMTVAAITRKISEAVDAGSIVDAVLDGLRDRFNFTNAMLLLKDPTGERLFTIGSRGYDRSGIGSEVLVGEGVIGTAASERRPVRVSDMSRIRRFGSAVHASSYEENRTRTILLPGMQDTMSQVALPMIAHGSLRGVLFLESSRRLAFTKEDEVALVVVATQAAAALALAETEAGEGQPSEPTVAAEPVMAGRQFRVVHYAYDDSIFIENEYLIKGVPGRLLVHLLRIYLREGRTEFTNREIRLSEELRLPDIKDNLETRLLLLRRRLEEKAVPIQLLRVGRGRIRLEVAGSAVLEEAAD
ncbi:GAF domain-containing protein [Microvirga makkahensis]|uniref:GAF domain-containing protein n=1 Tax=Microvirga makkahensis TaxID=1128670 RepID=A0A7X3MTC0_9HYPH|nr:GAF domain-containing protein [Microvirga makkahensis]MXQ12834.1 GAF domain-containing protein [Microvirga makkahensis]